MPGRTQTQEGLPIRATAKGAMTSRTNHHGDRQDQIGNMPARLSARPLRRQDAVKRYRVGEPTEAICRELAGAKRWLYKVQAQWRREVPTSKAAASLLRARCHSAPSRQRRK